MSRTINSARERDHSKFCREGPGFRSELEQYLQNENTEATTIFLYQIKAVLGVKTKLDSDPPNETKPCLIEAPTGSGKSGMIAMIPYILESQKVLILTPSAIISNQLAEAFGCLQDKTNCFFKEANFTQDADALSSFLEDVTVIKNSTDAIEKAMTNLVIVNAQKFGGSSRATLSMEYRRKAKNEAYRDEVTIRNVKTFFAQFDTLIVDEAHHYTAKTWKRIVTEFQKPSTNRRKKIVFLTATPYYFDRKSKKCHILGNKDRTAFPITKHMCIGLSIRELDFKMEYGDYNHYTQHISDILTEQEETENRFVPQAMVLASGRDEVSRIVEELNEFMHDLNYAVSVSGKTKDIAQGLKDFTDGKYRVAVTCKVGLEGYNNTRVTLCVIMREIRNGRIMFSQFVGRCMRIKRGLGKIDGEDVPDRNVGRVISYKKYKQKKMHEEYKSMDVAIATNDLSDDEEEDE